MPKLYKTLRAHQYTKSDFLRDGTCRAAYRIWNHKLLYRQPQLPTTLASKLGNRSRAYIASMKVLLSLRVSMPGPHGTQESNTGTAQTRHNMKLEFIQPCAYCPSASTVTVRPGQCSLRLHAGPYILTCVYIRPEKQASAGESTCVRKCTSNYVGIRLHACVYRLVRASTIHVYDCISMHICAHVYAYTHTYIYIHICILCMYTYA